MAGHQTSCAVEIAGHTEITTPNGPAIEQASLVRLSRQGVDQSSAGLVYAALMVAASLLVVEMILGGRREFRHDFSTFRAPSRAPGTRRSGSIAGSGERSKRTLGLGANGRGRLSPVDDTVRGDGSIASPA